MLLLEIKNFISGAFFYLFIFLHSQEHFTSQRCELLWSEQTQDVKKKAEYETPGSLARWM